MRRSPRPMGQLSAPTAILLTLCMLLLMLTPVASAWMDANENSNEGHLAVSAMHGGEDGRVTDDDGIIGNSRDGADHAEAYDRFARGITDSPRSDTPVLPEDNNGGIEGNDGEGGGAIIGDGARNANDATQGNVNGNTENGTADDGNSSGVLPWIIGIIVLLAIALVILALIPKKSKSH